MACPAILTGDAFLLRLLTHIDCQAQAIGSYGYQALGQPGSLAATVAAGLLTLFIALFGLRLLFGPALVARDVVLDVLRVGVVLTLAFSWPAFRTLIYDVTLGGPAEIAAVIAGPVSLASGEGLAARLQGADNAMLRLAELGTGRNTGALVNPDAPGQTFQGSVPDDENRFAQSRLVFLSGIIGSLGFLRIAAGLLLALAPLAAMLLLFGPTRGLFAGWLKGLVMVMIAALGVTLMLGVELAVIEPWLADALRLRALGYAVPAAPIELSAITLGFALARFTLIWLLARVAFNPGWLEFPRIEWPAFVQPAASAPPFGVDPDPANIMSRARTMSDSIETMMRREESEAVRRIEWREVSGAERNEQTGQQAASPRPEAQRLGDSWRRTAGQSGSASARLRDVQG